MYRAALSQAEIQADMAAPLGGPPDTTVPSQVSGLVASAVSSSRVDLSWSAASDNVGVTGYEVERCQGAGCSSFAAVTTVSALGWSDTGRSPGTSYSYRVRARDAAGNTGGVFECGDCGDAGGGGQSAFGADGVVGGGGGVGWGESVVDGGDGRSGCGDLRGGAVSGRRVFGVRAGGDDCVDVVGGYGSGGVDELFVSGAGAGHGEPGGPVFECCFGDDGVGVAAAAVEPRRRVRVRRRLGHARSPTRPGTGTGAPCRGRRGRRPGSSGQRCPSTGRVRGCGSRIRRRWT